MPTKSRRRASRAAPRRPTRATSGWKRWVRKHVLPNLAFAVPGYFASQFIQHLGGGALWLPRDWRDTVGVFGLLIGLAAFNVARWHTHAGAQPVAQPASKTGAPKERRARAGRVHWLWYGIAIVVLCGYVFLRYRCVYSWSPRLEWLELHGVPASGAEGLPAFIELEPQRSDGALAGNAPVEVWRGSFLVPLSFSPSTRAALTDIEREQGRDPILYSLECNEEWLIDRIQHHEEMTMALTTIVFFVVHVAVIFFASLGFGSEFSVPEEVASEVARFFWGGPRT